MVKAVAFDFGNTLVATGMPLNWQSFYHEAISAVLLSVGLKVHPTRIKQGEEILLKYNTRLNPREYEVKSDTIFLDMFNSWGIQDSSLVKNATETFASFFLADSKPYPDSALVLRALKRRGLKVGVLTNVAYGLDRQYIFQGAGELTEYIDILLTSTEVGFRKPNVKGYQELTRQLGVETKECIFVGDEEVDVAGANACGLTSVLIDRNRQDLRYGQTHTLTSLVGILDLV